MNAVSGQFALNLPFETAFVGMPLFLQGAVFDAGVALGVATTTGLRVEIGV